MSSIRLLLSNRIVSIVSQMIKITCYVCSSDQYVFQIAIRYNNCEGTTLTIPLIHGSNSSCVMQECAGVRNKGDERQL